MTFEKKGAEALDCFVNLRVSHSERVRLKQDAEFAGISVSELVRKQYFNRPIVVKSDLLVINELRKIGGLVKHLHNETGGKFYSHETSQALKNLARKINEIAGADEVKK